RCIPAAPPNRPRLRGATSPAMATEPVLSAQAGSQAAELPAAVDLAAPPASADGVDAVPSPASASAAGSAAAVLDKLATLEQARKAERERRREESRAAADPRESVAQFLRAFAARQRAVEEAIQRMLTATQHHPGAAAQLHPPPAAAAASGAEAEGAVALALDVSAATPEQVAASLELLGSEALSLDQSAAAASYYLPPYDQKQCAAAVAALRAAIEGARATLAPRRRFAFGSKKVSKVKGEEVSAAAAAGAPAPAGSGPAEPSHAAATAAVPTSSTPARPGPAHHPATASASASADDDDAGAALAAAAVSDEDRALVARGRGLMGLTDARVVLRGEQLAEGGAGGDYVLLGLTRCTVLLLGRLRSLRVAGLRGCTVVAGPVTGAAFVDDVRGSRLVLATYQVRVHRTHSTDLFLRARSNPIIEHSTGVRVAPWAAAVAPEPRLQALMQAHKLGEETGCWQQVDDFGWIKAVQSPNWCIMPEAERPQELMPVPERVWETAAEAEAGERDALAAGGGPTAASACSGDADEI
ncbi:Tubulin-specific chaperone C, partial [Tetrabaena socialis]